MCVHAPQRCMGATSNRLGSAQKRKLEQAARLLERRSGRRVTHGQAVEALADAALRRPDLLDAATDRLDLDLTSDPFFDPSFVFDMGKTTARIVDKLPSGG